MSVEEMTIAELSWRQKKSNVCRNFSPRLLILWSPFRKSDAAPVRSRRIIRPKIKTGILKCRKIFWNIVGGVRSINSFTAKESPSSKLQVTTVIYGTELFVIHAPGLIALAHKKSIRSKNQFYFLVNLSCCCFLLLFCPVEVKKTWTYLCRTNLSQLGG